VSLEKSVVGSATLPEPGGAFTYNLTITNNSIEPVTISSLIDDHTLSGECQALVGTSLAVGEGTSCNYEVMHMTAGVYRNEAAVTVTDDEGGSASATASASVEVIDVLPAVSLDKSVMGLATLPEPGGAFTYILAITNNSIEPVTITGLSDDYSLSAACLSLIGTSLAAGDGTSCAYQIEFTDVGTYGNTASVAVVDDEQNSASANSGASVTVTDTLPYVSLSKTVFPLSLPKPGGVFTYQLVITNNSVEPVYIVSLTDDYPISSHHCPVLIGTQIAAHGTAKCKYQVTHTYVGTYENNAEVVVIDNEGNEAWATATVDAIVGNKRVLPEDTPSPAPAGPFIPVTGSPTVAIVAGTGHTCQINIDSSVDCWGLNDQGQLGDLTLTDRNIPVKVEGLSGIISLAAGGDHTCALDSNGVVFCWGANNYGQLGVGNNENSNKALRVISLPEGIISITAGHDHTCAVTSSGRVYCWGLNDDGQLNDGTNSNRSRPFFINAIQGVSQVTGGEDYTCGIDEIGLITCWKDAVKFNISGLADGMKVFALNRWVYGGVSAANNGSVFDWHNGQAASVKVDSEMDGLSIGKKFACGFNESGDVTCWGENVNGELGNGETDATRSSPQVVEIAGVWAIASGANHTCVLTEINDTMCWGLNTHGQLGDGSNDSSAIPVEVHE
jgi:hypothetical protein